MYPHPELNSFLQGHGAQLPRKILNRMVEKAMYEPATCGDRQPQYLRPASMQPRCYAPLVDVTRSKCAFGPLALPKLARELHSEDRLIVRQAVTTLADIVVDPEKAIEAVDSRVLDRLVALLVCGDPYVRERSAMVLASMANQTAGREAIVKNLTAVANLEECLDDRLAAVRSKVALVLEALARDYCYADRLCTYGFVRYVTERLTSETKDILLVHLDTLKSLLHRNVKEKAIEEGTFEKLRTLLKRDDELVLCKTLLCLAILCEDKAGKQMAIQTDLLRTLMIFLRDERETVNLEAARVASFVTITTAGKLRALELGALDALLHLGLNKCRCSCELLLAVIKAVTNIAEAPEGRATLLRDYITPLEDLDVGESERMRSHKRTLLDVIRWKP